MNITYFPILKALAAEFTALKETKASTANRIVPLFEIPKVPDRKAYRESPTPKVEHINNTCEEIGNLWTGKHAMFDTFQWDPATTVENGEHVISYAYNALKMRDVKAVPVIGYDRWDIQDYQMSLKSVSQIHPGVFCLRLDHTAFEDSAEPDFFIDNLENILSTININPMNCHVLLDFEDVTQISAIDLFSKFDSLFNLLHQFRFKSYSIAGCSLPKSIDLAVKEKYSCGSVMRKEMLLWKNVRKQHSQFPIFFGDYSVRGPNTAERAFGNTNGKIRYTTNMEYFIARGQSMSLPPKGEQMWGLSQAVIDSGHYLEPSFSWGDAEILRCSQQEFKGSASSWVSIDTNHHLEYVVAEITEHERTIAAINARTRIKLK